MTLPRVCTAVGLALVAVLYGADAATAQPVPVPDTYGGDLWSRPRLTGDWGGFRDTLAKRGVVIDADLSQILQGVGSGGKEREVEYGGHADYTLNLDTGKLGLWPGGFLRIHAESSFGDSVNPQAGAIQAVNGIALFPVPGVSKTTVTNLTFAQFLSTWFGVYLGKVEGYGADANEFAHYGHEQFLNLGFGFNLVNSLAPISALGGGVIVVPWEGALLVAAVLDPSGEPDQTGFDDPFKDGVFVSGEARVTIKPFGLVGHQLVGGNWSNKERFSIDQDEANIARLLLFQKFPRLQDPGPVLSRIFERFFPNLLTPVRDLARKQDTWAVYYNFDQYLWHPGGDTTRGLGVFFRFGASDGNPNPVKYHYNVGIGGKGIVPGRPRDSFGIGWSRVELSDELVPFLRDRLRLGLKQEDAIELYYNVSLTGWLNATFDLQIVETGLKKQLDSNNRLRDVDTAVVGGLRVYTRF